MDQEAKLQSAHALRDAFETNQSTLSIVQNVQRIKSGGDFDFDGDLSKDPELIRIEAEDQKSYMRKLKFQYLEQNAKDRYIKAIVSDIDDAPIATDEDNREMAQLNAERKASLKVAKAKGVQVHNDVSTLAPLVQDDYDKVNRATARATDLAKKIIDARLALSRLRAVHPHPRLTISSADQKINDQIVEMQAINDEMESSEEVIRGLKSTAKSRLLELERLRPERADVETKVKESGVMDKSQGDDARLPPLYEWYTTSLALHRSFVDLEDSHSEFDNKLQLRYKISPRMFPITVELLFDDTSRKLVGVDVLGVEALGIDLSDDIGMYVASNDVHGAVAGVLARVRQAS